MNAIAYTYKKGNKKKDLIIPCHITGILDSGHAPKIPKAEDYEMFGIIDTGANSSAISKELADHLGLIPIGAKKTIFSANGEFETDLFIIDLHLSDDIVIEGLVVSELKNIEGFQFFIGLDVILKGDFAIESGADYFTVKYRYPCQGNSNIKVKPTLLKTYQEKLAEEKAKK